VLLQGNPRPIAGVICHLLVWGCLASAQDGTVRTAPEPGKSGTAVPAPQGVSHGIEESRPPLYYLKDKQGSLQAVPGLSFEEFEDLYKLKLQLAQGQPRPRYSLQQMSISGTAAAEQADLTVQFRVLLREDQWTRVPLGLDGSLLREPAVYKGPGEQFLHFEPDGEGYVSWIRGQAGQQHELTLKLLVPLSAVGEETRLKLLLPRATSAELKLRVPAADAVARVSEGAALLGASPAGSTATELKVGGLGGDFQMAWRRAGGRAAETTPVLEASGVVLAKLDSRGADCEATLSVRRDRKSVV